MLTDEPLAISIFGLSRRRSTSGIERHTISIIGSKGASIQSNVVHFSEVIYLVQQLAYKKRFVAQGASQKSTRYSGYCRYSVYSPTQALAERTNYNTAKQGSFCEAGEEI